MVDKVNKAKSLKSCKRGELKLKMFFCDSQSLPPFITITTMYDSCLVIYFDYKELIIFRLCHDNVRKKFKNDGEYQNENEISRRINKKQDPVV